MTNNGAARTRRRRAEHSGRRAEFLASAAYMMRGFQILERRFRAPQGEIDLIARRGRLIAFIEVKLRRDIDAAILAVTPAGQRRLQRAAGNFLSLRPQFAEFAVRYDIAAVADWRVSIVADAWRADG